MLKISLNIAGRTIFFMRRIALLVILLLALAAAGLVLALRYSVLPDIGRYHDDIAAAVGKAVGMAVEIDKVEADWHGIGPHLRLSGIRILDRQKRTTLALRRVDAVVSWKTLLAGELRLASLEIDQPDLMVRRDVQGVLHVSGIEIDQKSADNSFSNMLLNQSRIVVRGAHISWLDEQQKKPLLVFNDVNLLLDNIWHYHRFAIRALPPPELSTQLDVRGDFYGKNFDDMQSWSGEIYTQLEYADVGAWKTWLPLPAYLRQGSGALRGWLGVEDGKISHATADLALVNVKTRLSAELPVLDIRVLKGRLGWRDVADGLEISMQNFSLKLFDNFVLKPTDVFVRLDNLQQAAGSSGEVRANMLELEDLGKLMEYLPLKQNVKQQFAEFSPHGRVANVHALWYFDSDKKMHYKVRGKFDDLALRGAGKLPAFSGLSGEMDGSESGGTLSINSRNLKLDAPQLMPVPLAFNTFAAQASWQVDDGELEVKLRNLAVGNEDIAGTAYGSYRTLADSPGKVDLSVHLTRASIPHVGRYIPLIALGGDTRKWINQSLLAGKSNDFNLRLKGDLNDFPFAGNNKGIFKVHARATGVALEYAKGWPRIDNGNVEFSIYGKKLTVAASSAMTADIRLKNTVVSIPDLLGKDLMLHVNGEAEAENSRALAFIQASPVRGYISGFTDNAVASGMGKLNLKLEIPLQGSQPVKVAGNYHFTNSEVELERKLPTLRRLNGDLSFTESGASTKNIVAQILGGPASLLIDSGEGGAMNIRLEGRANFGVLREINPHPLLGRLAGEPAWSIEIGVHNKLTSVLLTSSLKGLQSELPPPFSKLANETVNLRFDMKDLRADQRSLKLQYGSLIHANIMSLKDDEGVWGVERGNINFGGVAKNADKEGLWVTGTLPHLALDGLESLAGSLGGESDAAPVAIAGADFTVQKLSGYDYGINNLHVRASSHNDILTAQLAAKELNGEVSWQAGDMQAGEHGRLVAHLRNFDIVREEGVNEKKTQPKASVQKMQVGATVELPLVDLTIDRLSHKGRQLGRLELLAQHHGQDYQLEHCRLINPDGVLNADGKWSMSADASETRVNVKLDIANAGNVLARSGFPNSVKNGSGKLDGSFSWAGTPMMYDKAGLNGTLSMDTGKGQFLQIDPGIGKLLSILSLQALPKRITLDFEDVFSKGFEFDKISGTAEIKQGVLITNNLKIEGSSAKVNMAGQMDLVNETQNLRVRIVPAVGNSVALISALVATPVVGAGVYLAGKILNDPLGQMVAFEYDITGGWTDPVVEKVAAKKKTENSSVN